MTGNMRGIRFWVILAVLVGLLPHPAVAQMGAGGGNSAGGGAYALEDGESNLKFAGIPIPGYSDVLGFNMGLVGMAYYKMDRTDDSLPPSVTGLFGFYSANKSWMGSAFQKFHLDGDRWRAMAALGTGSVKYQFNPAAIDPGFPNVFVDYSTVMNFLFAQGSRRSWGQLYLGLSVVTWEAQVTLEPEIVKAPNERYVGPGFTAELDMRDHTMYPTDGYNLDARYLVYRDGFGSDRDFEGLTWSATGYQALGDSNQVLAGRILHDAAFGDVPFSAQAIVNGNRNLRGYSNGQHRADQLFMVEAEYRWMFHPRWGAVAFAGAAWSANDLSYMSVGETLPAVGLGVRFRMIETYKINARVDYGWGKDDQAVYFSIGEAY